MNSLQSNDMKFKWVSAHNAENQQDYVVLTLPLDGLIESWRASIVAHEWLYQGQCRAKDDLKTDDLKQEWQNICDQFESGADIERPLLGIGMLDNIEVGTNRAVVSVAHHLGLSSIEVLAPKSMADTIDSLARLINA